jgi:hypothetical protein
MKIVRPQPVTDAILLSSSVPENDYAEWSGATTYGLGAYVIKAATHRVYKSLQASNLNHDPAAEADPDNPVWWQNYSATNRWMMFDEVVGQQTSKTDSIAISLQANVRVDSIALLNISALTVNIKMTSADNAAIYDETFNLTNQKTTNGWYAYYFTTPLTEFLRKTDLFVTDLPPYKNAKIDVTLYDAGNTVKCGEVIYGLSNYIGGTEYGARIGIQDYSVKTVDDFGNFSVLQRAFARRGSFTIEADASEINNIQALLSSIRSKPTLFIGSDLYESTMIYGFYKDFDITIAYANMSICSLDVDGLT